MSLTSEFAYYLDALYSPYTDPLIRRDVDAWIQRFRDTLDTSTWEATVRILLRDGPHRETAAVFLAHKARGMALQLRLVDANQIEILVHEVAGALAGGLLGGEGSGVVLRLVMMGLARLVLGAVVREKEEEQENETCQRSDVMQWISTLLPREAMVQFLMVLAEECQEWWARGQRSMLSVHANVSMEDSGANHIDESSVYATTSLRVKLKAQEWSVEVGRWLCFVHGDARGPHHDVPWHTAEDSGSLQLNSFTPQSSNVFQVAEVGVGSVPDIQREKMNRSSVAVLRCFTAWVKWGALFFMSPEHAIYLLTVANTLLWKTATISKDVATAVDGDSMDPCLVSAEGIVEAIENSPDSGPVADVLLQIVISIAKYITQCAHQSLQSSNTITLDCLKAITMIITSFAAANTSLVSSGTSEGSAVRSGVLDLILAYKNLWFAPNLGNGANTGTNSSSFAYNGLDDDTNDTLKPLESLLDALSDVLVHMGSARVNLDDSTCTNCAIMSLDNVRAFASTTFLVIIELLEWSHDEPIQHRCFGITDPRDDSDSIFHEQAPSTSLNPLFRQNAIHHPAWNAAAELLGPANVMHLLETRVQRSREDLFGSAMEPHVKLSYFLRTIESTLCVLKTLHWTDGNGKHTQEEGDFQETLHVFDRALSFVLAADAEDPRHRDPGSPVTTFHAELLGCCASLSRTLIPSIFSHKACYNRDIVGRFAKAALCQALSALDPNTPKRSCSIAVDEWMKAGAMALRDVCCRVPWQDGILDVEQDILPSISIALRNCVVFEENASLLQRVHGDADTARPSEADDVHLSEGVIVALAHAARVTPSSRLRAAQSMRTLVDDIITNPFKAATQERRRNSPSHRTVHCRRLQQLRLERLGILMDRLHSNKTVDEKRSNGEAWSTVADSLRDEAIAVFLHAWPDITGEILPRSLAEDVERARRIMRGLSRCIRACTNAEDGASIKIPASIARSFLQCCVGSMGLQHPSCCGMGSTLRHIMMRFWTHSFHDEVLQALEFLVADSHVQRHMGFRGGDTDPEVAGQLLEIAQTFLCLRIDDLSQRQTSLGHNDKNWMQYIFLLDRFLLLASMNICCHHNKTSIKALEVFHEGVRLALRLLETDTRISVTKGPWYELHALSDNECRVVNAVLVPGMILACISLESKRSLRAKVSSMLCDALALVVVSSMHSSSAQHQQAGCSSYGKLRFDHPLGVDGVIDAAVQLLSRWLEAAGERVLWLLASSDSVDVWPMMPPEDQRHRLRTLISTIVRWDWMEILRIIVESLMDGASSHAVRRRMQRETRAMVELFWSGR